jgi:hypothetical protein
MDMKISKYSILFLLCFIIRVTGLPAAVGYLSVQTEPGTCTYLDSQLVADQSFQNLALTTGTYMLHVYSPVERSWQDRGFNKQIFIQEAETLSFDLRQDKLIHILSNPVSGLVYDDSILLGRTPLVLQNTYPRSKQFTITKNGFQSAIFGLESGKDKYILSLAPLKPPLTVTAFQSNNRPANLQWLHEGLIITSLASSWLSFLLKRNADTNYEKYMHSAVPEDIKKYYDRTVRFDHYAEISFTVSLISLAGYFYMLLSE